MTPPDLGPLGLALDPLQFELAPAAENAGYTALWIAGGQLPTLDPIADLLAASRSARVVPGIISADVHPATAVAERFAEWERSAPGRFVAGLGGPQQARSPLTALAGYLDELDNLGVPAERRLVAALGPRKLELARDRSAGAITLLTTPEHTTTSRAMLGPDRTLVVYLPVVLDADPATARAAARTTIGFLTGVAGYRSNLARLGFSADDIEQATDPLVDAVVPWGTAETIAAAVADHRAAGADHVVLSPLASDHSPDPEPTLRQLAEAATA